MANWYKLGKGHAHFYINTDDKCIYAREYKSRQGYGGSLTNQLVLNFKKSPSKKRTPQWRHREKAVKTFAREAEKLFPLNFDSAITAIPSSKHKNDPEYDCRFEDFFQELLKSRSSLNIEWPVEVKETNPASHRAGGRNPEHIKKNYIWKEFKKTPPKRLCVFDDVLTTGAHFRAMSDFLRENGYKGQIIGIFWSRAISTER